jgi:hypothetical protein
MTRVVISQPMYFPWAGFMAQMALADIFIWLDDAQFSKGSFTSRIQIKMPNGRKWMSIPLVGQGSFQPITNLQAAERDWLPNHRKLLMQSLIQQPHAQVALDLFDRVMAGSGSLCDLLISGAEAQAIHMGIKPHKMLRSSQMNVCGSSGDRVLKLIKAVNGTEYLTGHGARNYLDHDTFNKNGVSVSYMTYDLLPWPQLHEDFTPFVTGLDLIASQTPEQAKAHLRPTSVDWREFIAP